MCATSERKSACSTKLSNKLISYLYLKWGATKGFWCELWQQDIRRSEPPITPVYSHLQHIHVGLPVTCPIIESVCKKPAHGIVTILLILLLILLLELFSKELSLIKNSCKTDILIRHMWTLADPEIFQCTKSCGGSRLSAKGGNLICFSVCHVGFLLERRQGLLPNWMGAMAWFVPPGFVTVCGYMNTYRQTDQKPDVSLYTVHSRM